jgi:hypothetical protein
MTSLAIETVVAQLVDAGLNLSLAPAGGLAVAPACPDPQQQGPFD